MYVCHVCTAVHVVQLFFSRFKHHFYHLYHSNTCTAVSTKIILLICFNFTCNNLLFFNFQHARFSNTCVQYIYMHTTVHMYEVLETLIYI